MVTNWMKTKSLAQVNCCFHVFISSMFSLISFSSQILMNVLLALTTAHKRVPTMREDLSAPVSKDYLTMTIPPVFKVRLVCVCGGVKVYNGNATDDNY